MKAKRSTVRHIHRVVKRADAVWAQCIAARDGYRCRRCRKVCRGHAHHIISRNVTIARWDLRNGVYLCAECHAAVHASDRDFGMTEELAAIPRNPVNKRELAARMTLVLGECLKTGNFSVPDGVEVSDETDSRRL